MRQSCSINSTDVGSWLAWEAVTTEVRKSTCARKYLQGQATIKTWAQHTVRFITLSMMVVLYWPTRSAGIFDSGACLQFWFWGISGLDWVRFGRNLSRFLGWAWLFPHRWWGQGFFQGRRRCWLLCSRFWNSNVYGEKMKQTQPPRRQMTVFLMLRKTEHRHHAESFLLDSMR